MVARKHIHVQYLEKAVSGSFIERQDATLSLRTIRTLLDEHAPGNRKYTRHLRDFIQVDRGNPVSLHRPQRGSDSCINSVDGGERQASIVTNRFVQPDEPWFS
jgi:hypothetical protein